MDRLVSEEERIRRAEDVLERRRNTDLRISSENFVKEKANKKIKNMFIQILICLLIYCGIYYVKNSQNENLKSFLNNINGILEYDVDFKKIYEELCKKYESLNINKSNKKTDNIENIQENNQGEDNQGGNNQSENNQEENNQEGNNQEGNNQEKNNQEDHMNNVPENEKNTQNITTQDDIGQKTEKTISMGIGGGTEDSVEQISNFSTEQKQMKVDAEYIKQNFNIINPLSSGFVTSKFGARESTEIISANHKGIDLGATTGTVIVGAMDGTVIEASAEGDFGLHLKVANGDITVIYAHCSELLVKQGDQINQGDKIAKVGSTGKATGPHLHFEIRRENRAVNPEYLLQF
ncbi:MAG: M23 family metallopeptidase [Clostridia bacterium]|nr:M23 family metallopeptidase [Clostridia bacterium]